MEKCAFCDPQKVPRSRIIAKNKLVFSFPTNIPITPGHTLIVPVRCVASFSDLSEKELKAIFLMRKEISGALKKKFGAEGFHFAWNEGAVAGQSVPHFHLHVIPRMKGDTGITEYEPRKFLYRPGSREPSPEKELESVAKEIKKVM